MNWMWDATQMPEEREGLKKQQKEEDRVGAESGCRTHLNEALVQHYPIGV